jgi:hypothetical protein
MASSSGRVINGNWVEDVDSPLADRVQPGARRFHPPWLGGLQYLLPGDAGFTDMGDLRDVMARDGALLPAPAGGVELDRTARTFDCAPTLTDSQVLEFCRSGVLLLPAAVPDEVNALTRDYLDGTLPADPAYMPAGMTEDDVARIRRSSEPSTILLERWFIEGVLLLPRLAGVLRSLLGPQVGLPVSVGHHGGSQPAQQPQQWHQDGNCSFGPELNFVEVFYFPQDTPQEVGPTEVRSS